MTALSRLARVKGRDKPVGAADHGQRRAAARAGARVVAGQALSAAPGNVIGMDGVIDWLELNGFTRASTVREPGEYAVRGGILDLFPPGMDSRCGSISSATRWRRSAASIRRPSAATISCARSIWCRSRNSSSSPRPSAASAPAMSQAFGAAAPDDLLV